MWFYTYKKELYHHGVKGQKWGVRRTPEELRRARMATEDETSVAFRIAHRSTVSGHKPTPKESTPNTVMDHISHTGKVDTRTFYGKSGMKEKDIHTTDHGHPKQHQYGEHGEHVVLYEWDDDKRIKNKIKRDLDDIERKENSDIL